MKKNPVIAGLSGSIALLLLLSSFITSVLTIRANTEAKRADQAAKKEAQSAKEAAQLAKEAQDQARQLGIEKANVVRANDETQKICEVCTTRG